MEVIVSLVSLVKTKNTIKWSNSKPDYYRITYNYNNVDYSFSLIIV